MIQVNKEMKSGVLLTSFARYCVEHKEQRFWQALCNWANVQSIHIVREVSKNAVEYIDTWYMEGKNK